MLEMLKGTLQGIKLSALAVPPPRPGLEPAATPDRAKETPARKLLWIVALALLGLVFVIAALAV